VKTSASRSGIALVSRNSGVSPCETSRPDARLWRGRVAIGRQARARHHRLRRPARTKHYTSCHCLQLAVLMPRRSGAFANRARLQARPPLAQESPRRYCALTALLDAFDDARIGLKATRRARGEDVRRGGARLSTRNDAMCQSRSSLADLNIMGHSSHGSGYVAAVMPAAPHCRPRVRSLGGFRTPATAHSAPSFMADIQNNAQKGRTMSEMIVELPV
jgi:hypothetical protein